MSLKENVIFLKKFFTQPSINAAIWPTSAIAASLLCKSLKRDDAQCVLEFGPGLGSLTVPIIEHKNNETQYIGIEYDANYVSFLQDNFTTNTIQFISGSVVNCQYILGEHQLNRPDILISSLPNTIFEQNPEFLEIIKSYISKGTQFRVITYLPYTFCSIFKDFDTKIYDFTFRNVPPCFICGIN